MTTVDGGPLDDHPTEAERVEAWRLRVLLEAGYPIPLAERLAASPCVDLHLAVDLIQHGCQPDIAARILL